jgi:hypothetical protein
MTDGGTASASAAAPGCTGSHRGAGPGGTECGQREQLRVRAGDADRPGRRTVTWTNHDEEPHTDRAWSWEVSAALIT